MSGRRPLRWTRRPVVWVAGGLVVLLALLGVGVPLPVGPFRGALESRASEALGRPVQLGSLRLVVGLRPRLAVEELRLGHVLGDRDDVLRVERAELALALLPLLQRRVHVERAVVSGVAIRLDPEAFPPSEPADSQPAPAAGRGLAGWSLDVAALSLADVAFVLHRTDLEPLEASLERVDGKLLWDEALELTLTGRYRELPVSARLAGASLARLIEGAEQWPLRVDAELAGSPLELAARLATRGGVYRVGDLEGRAGDTRFGGWLALENLATRPRASGRVTVGAIELALPPPETAAAGSAPTRLQLPGSLGAGEAADADEADAGPLALFLGLLRDFETDLELEVERIAGVGPTVENLTVALRVAEGGLRFPVALVADGIPMEGTLVVGQDEEVPELTFRLAAEDFRVDALAARLLPDAGIAGPFEALRLELEGRGSSLVAFLEALRVELHMANASLSYGVDRPVDFGVRELRLALAEHGPIELQLRGDLLGEAVELDLSGGSMEDFLAELPWALELRASGAGARARLSGEARGALDALDLTGELAVEGERLSRLEPWLGTLPFPDAAYALRARVEDTPQQTRIDLDEVRLGTTNLVGQLGARRGDEQPLMWADLRIEELDVSPWIEATRRAPEAGPGPGEAAGGLAIDAPILPGGLEVRDADFDLGVDRLVAGDLVVGDMGFVGGFREGFLPSSEFRFSLGPARFAGTVRADLRESPHDATFTFATRDVDVGDLLSRVGVAEGVRARAGALRIEVGGEGASLGDLLDRSDFLVELDDLRWSLGDPGSGSVVHLVLEHGELRSPRGDEPIRLEARGRLQGIPVGLSMQTEQLSFFDRPEDSVPLDLRLEMAGATLEISSRASLPIERSELDLELELTGRSLAEASRLFDYELPPIGPYRLASRLHAETDDYRLSGFDLNVGRSRLRGSGRLDLRGSRPRIELELASDRMQLDDFAAAFETPEGDAAPEEPGDAGLERLQGVRGFWSPEGLLGFDGRLVASAAQVLSGRDELGRGRFVVSLEKGRLVLDPLLLELPGGSLDLRSEYAFVARGGAPGVEARIRAHTERFDYGPLARRVDPDTEAGGWISLDLDVAGTAPEARRLLAHADGTLDFLVAPENIDANAFELWAVSLLRFLIPRLDPSARSTLNCLVARFDLDDGILDEKALLLDTTAMVVRGDARVDFRKERFRAALEPMPKKAQLLSLQTRVDVDGSFDDFHIGVAPDEIVMTLIRFASSVVVAPLRRIFEEPLPADGEKTCLEAWEEPRS